MKLTLGQAAKAAKRSKDAVKSPNSGGISAEKDDKGRWQIDPSECFPGGWSANPFPNSLENQSETPEETHENSALGVRKLRCLESGSTP